MFTSAPPPPSKSINKGVRYVPKGIWLSLLRPVGCHRERARRLGWSRGTSGGDRGVGGRTLRLWETWKIAQLGSCRLGKNFGKVPNISKNDPPPSSIKYWKIFTSWIRFCRVWRRTRYWRRLAWRARRRRGRRKRRRGPVRRWKSRGRIL